jgi:hypothetical protein
LSASILRLRELDVISGLAGRNGGCKTDRRNRSKNECKHSHLYLLMKSRSLRDNSVARRQVSASAEYL